MTDWDVIALSSTTLTYNDTTVVNGMMYRYRITSMTVVGEGPSSNIMEAEPGSRPSPPSNIKIIPFDGYVKVTWDYPMEDGGFPITKVTIYRGTSSGNMEQVFRTDQKNGTYNDVGLTNGARYFFSLTAMNKLGESVHSEVVKITPFGRPTEPFMLRVVERTTTSVRIGWLPPIDYGGSPIQHYIIYRARGGGIEERVAGVEGNHTEFMDVGLKAGKSYSYSISAVNGRGESVRSDPLEVTLPKEKGQFFSPFLLIILLISLLLTGCIVFFYINKKKINENEE